MSDEAWREGLALARGLDQKQAPLRERFATVQRAIVDGLAEGRLISVVRPLAGGGFSEPLEATLWNTERIGSRFFWCQMDPKRPFGPAVGGDRYQYIYIAASGLEQLLRRRAHQGDPVSTALAEKKCGKWLRELMLASPKKRTASKRELLAQAMENFGIAERAFVRAWANAISDTCATAWSAPGAPKKDRNPRT